MSEIQEESPAIVPPLNNPPYPANRHQLVNGSVIRGKNETVQQLGLRVGDPIVIGWDGQYVRFGSFTWSVEQLDSEIDCGFWEVVTVSPPFHDPTFRVLFEMCCGVKQ